MKVFVEQPIKVRTIIIFILTLKAYAVNYCSKKCKIKQIEGDFITDQERAVVIAERLKTIASSNDMTIIRFLQTCHLHRDFVAQMVRRGTIPSASAFITIAEFYNISTDYMFGLTEKPKR